MLTEQDFAEMINDKTPHSFCDVYPECAGKSCKMDDDGIVICHERNSLAKHLHNQHIKETERLMELAFNAGAELTPDNPDSLPYQLKFKYQKFQDFKDSLNADGSSV